MMVRALLPALLLCYVAVIIPLTDFMKHRPVVVKLGYTPEADVVKLVAGDQVTLLAEMWVLKVLFYFGTVAEDTPRLAKAKPEYFNMFKTLEGAIKLDPYNQDAYYFAQAAFTWEVGHAADVNRLLQYGMKYRTKDWTLPFYIAFNDAYFLKDYSGAAKYMQKAADLSHQPLLINLAARYFYESGRTDLGIIFLKSMEGTAKDRKVKNLFEIRKKALLAVKRLTDAVDKYRNTYHRLPANLSELVSRGVLNSIPEDPYGGTFYIGGDGKIRSTSKFAFGSQTK